MKTQDTKDRFILIIWALIAKVREITCAASVPVHPGSELVSDFLLIPIITRCARRRQAETARLSGLVFRFSSSDHSSTCWSGLSM